MENFIFLCSLKGIRNFDTGICDPSERLSILTLHETKDVGKKVFNNGNELGDGDVEFTFFDYHFFHLWTG